MSASHPPAAAPMTSPTMKERATPYLVPYYITVASVLGLITVVFVVVVLVMAIVVTNFNPIGWME